MYDTILVPTDGSQAAKNAATGAIGLAERFDAELHAIYVHRDADYPKAVRDELSTELAEQATAVLDEIASDAEQRGLRIITELVATDDPVHEAIVQYATDHDADIISMGTHSRTGLDHLILGSVTERTLRVSPLPVLTVHSESELGPETETILVATDGSQTASAAATHAIGLAAATGSSLHAVHVINLVALSGEYGSGSVFDTLRQVGQRALDEIADRAADAGVESVETAILTGAPSQEIIDYATDQEADLVVMGTHGRTGLNRLLIGSVTEKVVRLAEMPVLSVSIQESQ